MGGSGSLHRRYGGHGVRHPLEEQYLLGFGAPRNNILRDRMSHTDRLIIIKYKPLQNLGSSPLLPIALLYVGADFGLPRRYIYVIELNIEDVLYDIRPY